MLDLWLLQMFPSDGTQLIAGTAGLSGLRGVTFYSYVTVEKHRPLSPLPSALCTHETAGIEGLPDNPPLSCLPGSSGLRC